MLATLLETAGKPSSVCSTVAAPQQQSTPLLSSRHFPSRFFQVSPQQMWTKNRKWIWKEHSRKQDVGLQPFFLNESFLFSLLFWNRVFTMLPRMDLNPRFCLSLLVLGLQVCTTKFILLLPFQSLSQEQNSRDYHLRVFFQVTDLVNRWFFGHYLGSRK